MTTHLIIPDAHAMPNVSNERFTWLGKLVAEIQPDVIVDIGDWCDMESLCIYDKGKLQFEGRRYKKDVQCALDAKERFENEIVTLVWKFKKFYPAEDYHQDYYQKNFLNYIAYKKACQREEVLQRIWN